jgi:alpha-glucosidase
MDKMNGRPSTTLGSIEVPFNPTGAHPLDEKTMSLDGFHYCGKDSPLIQCSTPRNLYEFDYHNLNGFGEGVATNNALKDMGHPLPFIITRSSLFGSGAYVQHWTGDNDATWEDLYLSISEIFNFGLFGIPFVGADICGFAGETTPELCARWMQLGALYPFARNHNVEGA